MAEMENKETNIEEVSINTAQATDTAEPAPHPTVTGADTVQTADCGTQVDSLIGEVRELNDKYLRMAAELENTRRRAAIDAESMARTRAMSIAGKILPVMDAVDAALKHSPDDDGIKSMARALESVFAQIGITRIGTVGEKLNPQFHNAIQIMPIPSDGDAKPEPDTIAAEMQAGYMFGDSVLRTAMVVVYK